MFEVGFDEFCGGDEWEEEGHVGEFVGALDAGGDAGDVLREWEGNDGGGCVGEGGGDVRVVGRSGEESDGGVAAEEETC